MGAEPAVTLPLQTCRSPTDGFNKRAKEEEKEESCYTGGGGGVVSSSRFDLSLVSLSLPTRLRFSLLQTLSKPGPTWT